MPINAMMMSNDQQHVIVRPHPQQLQYLQPNANIQFQDLARIFFTSHSTIMLALKKLGKVYKIGC